MKPSVNWVVKASKLCNLRCSYCYEWDQLADKQRISPTNWRRIFHNARQHAKLLEDKLGGLPEVNFVWHGGEPLALPKQYFETVLSYQRDVFADSAVRCHNFLQTNLYTISEAKIALLKTHGFGVGVSFDAVSGVRKNVRGRSTELRVLANMRRLRRAGVSFGAICVVGKHNHARIDDVYRFFASNGIGFRALKLMGKGPDSRPFEDFHISEAETAQALSRLAELCLVEEPSDINVDPIFGLAQIVARYKLGVHIGVHNRAKHGDGLFVVNTNGDLYLHGEEYQSHLKLGNVFVQDIEDILSSNAYQDSLARDAAIVDNVCHGCKYFQFCGSFPAVDDRVRMSSSNDRCSVPYLVMNKIEQLIGNDLKGAGRQHLLVLDYSRKSQLVAAPV